MPAWPSSLMFMYSLEPLLHSTDVVNDLFASKRRQMRMIRIDEALINSDEARAHITQAVIRINKCNLAARIASREFLQE